MGKKSCRIALPVLAVVAAICYIYFTSVFVFIDRWFGLWSSPGLMNAVVFTAIAAMCVLNYVVAIFTDPGRVPACFVPDIEDTGSPIQEIKRKVFFSGCFCFFFIFGFMIRAISGLDYRLW